MHRSIRARRFARGHRFVHGLIVAAFLLVATPAFGAVPGTASAIVHKASVQVHSAPDFNAPTVATLQRDATVRISGQQGLWFQVATAQGASGYVRVNDVRMQYAGNAAAGSNMRALFTGKAGKGRVSETAGVRGIDESDLKSASFDAAQFAKLESYRVSPQAAAADAGSAGWRANKVPYASEFKPQPEKGGKATQKQKRGGLGLARGLLSAVGVGSPASDSAFGVAEASAGKSELEQQEEEIALGPEISGRILGAAKLWNDDDAQRRVNRIGRWMASQTSRPDLPWTFGVIDSRDINAYAAPGGYILVTRGLYELLADDEEVAAVLGHELSHVVQRDHYNVIHKQEKTAALQGVAADQVRTGGLATSMAKDYVARHGASVMASSLDREAEYRADQAAEIYLARAGFNPLALYAVLQKMTALGAASGNLAQLYKTHPPLDERMDRIDRRGYSSLERYTGRK
jgi:beta-barrel assembly-enhancing protease